MARPPSSGRSRQLSSVEVCPERTCITHPKPRKPAPPRDLLLRGRPWGPPPTMVLRDRREVTGRVRSGLHSTTRPLHAGRLSSGRARLRWRTRAHRPRRGEAPRAAMERPGSRTRSRLPMTSSALIGVPSENASPSRSVKSTVRLPSLKDQPSASAGRGARLPSIARSPSKSWAITARAPASPAAAGSMVAGADMAICLSRSAPWTRPPVASGSMPASATSATTPRIGARRDGRIRPVRPSRETIARE